MPRPTDRVRFFSANRRKNILLLPLLLIFTTTVKAEDQISENLLQQKTYTRVDDCETSMFLAGDTILTRPWSHVSEPEFLDLVAEIRAADVAIVNLETVIHTYKGYAQADSGGFHLASPPEVATDLAWAGVDMVGHANNHSFDYGSIGVLENLKFVTDAGIVLAGSGPDLQRARAPTYFMGQGGKKIGLVSITSTFVPYGRASNSSTTLPGRPGVNFMTIIGHTEIIIPAASARLMQELVQFFGFKGTRFDRKTFDLAGLKFRVGDAYSMASGLRVQPEDLAGNLSAIRSAAEEADIVVASLHYHGDQPQERDWLRSLAHQAIDSGAEVFYVHGPHFVRGIEIYKEKPIFFGMGDFAFQIEHIARLPAEVYEEFDLSHDLSPQEAIAAAWGWPNTLLKSRKTFEGFAGSLCFIGGKVVDIRLLPVDLQFNAPLEQRGRPRYAKPALSAEIIKDVAAASKPYGTEVTYDALRNVGRVRLRQRERHATR